MSTRPAFLCHPVRTPIGRYGGALARLRADELAATPLRALKERLTRLDWEAVDDVVLGCTNQAGEDSRNVARQALLLAGLPVGVPGRTVNRLCASGLQAVLDAAHTVAVGEAELLIAGGVESMSRAPYVLAKSEEAFARAPRLEDSTIGWRFVNPALHARHGTDSMPETAETVARERSISREDQDAFALRSHQRAAAAIGSGRMALEVVPVTVHAGKSSTVVLEDEHVRADASLAALARLKPLVAPDGSVTAGNSAGINDGAAALVVASEEALARHGLTPLARVLGGAAAGVEPRVMGLGPVPATRKLCARLGLTVADFDVVELNEAFSAQALACLRELGFPDDAPHVNPHGGAIALGHPLGMSGARLVGTAAVELHQRPRARRALVTLCVGVGQGLSVALERA